VEPYKLNWETGEDKILLVSVGTGASPVAKADLQRIGQAVAAKELNIEDFRPFLE
jgi:hypothetical protein